MGVDVGGAASPRMASARFRFRRVVDADPRRIAPASRARAKDSVWGVARSLSSSSTTAAPPMPAAISGGHGGTDRAGDDGDQAGTVSGPT